MGPMPYRSLADFLDELGQAGELARVDARVDPRLEMAEIAQRVARSKGPALLFASPEGSDVPVVTNLLGTPGRIERALGGAPAQAAQRLAEVVMPSGPESWLARLKTGAHESLVRRYQARTVKTGPCQQVVRLASDVDLGAWPIVQSGSGEPGPTITAGQLWMLDPDAPRTAIGRFDLAVVGAQELALFAAPHEEPARLLGRAKRPVPAAVVLGGDPLELLAAAAPLPVGFDAAGLASLLGERPAELVRCRTTGLEVPAGADIVLEGLIDPAQEPVEAGPLVSGAGCYAPARLVKRMRVTAITHRGNPVFPALATGAPPNELGQIARAMQRVVLPLVRLAIPELVDYELPMFGAVRGCAVVSIDKSHAGQARKVAQALWGYDGLTFARLVVIVDADVDVCDAAAVAQAVADRFDPGGDLVLADGPADPWLWDPGRAGLSTRMALDATRKLPGESRAPGATPVEMPAGLRQRVDERWLEFGLGPG